MSFLSITTNFEKRFVYILGAAVVIFAALYIYFVITSIVHTVIRQETEYAIAQAHSEVSTLETQYLTRQKAITKELALDSGFAPVSDKVYATRQTLLTRTDRLE